MRGLALMLAVAVLAGCFQVQHPSEWACSPTEPRCPEGLVCDGRRCVPPGDAAGDLMHRPEGMLHDGMLPDAMLADTSPTPDLGPTCAEWSDWTCVELAFDYVKATCGNRVVFCDDDYGWFCECEVNGSLVYDPDCGDAYGYNGCDAANDAVYYGCCVP